MTFKDFILEGVYGHFCVPSASGGTYAFLYGLGLLLCTLTYFLGSLNFSIIVSHVLYHDDIRRYGSGNAGSTNMLRIYGRRAAAFTFLGDALKAVLSCLFGYFMMGYIGACIAGFFCILGHIFPIYYHFRGGKGIVTVAFMVLMLDPVVFAILFGFFLVILVGSRIVSLASIMCALLYPLVLYRIEGPGTPVVFAFLCTALVVFMHRENMMRIFHGQESRIDFKALFRKGTPPVTEVKKAEGAATNDEGEGTDEASSAEAAPATPRPYDASDYKKTSVSRAKQKRRREQAKQEKRNKA